MPTLQTLQVHLRSGACSREQLIVVAAKSPENKRKRRARRLFLRERKEDFHFRKETDRPEVLYKVREDGIWEENRRSPDELQEYRSLSKIQQGKTKYKPSLHELVAVSIRGQRELAASPSSTSAAISDIYQSQQHQDDIQQLLASDMDDLQAGDDDIRSSALPPPILGLEVAKAFWSNRQQDTNSVSSGNVNNSSSGQTGNTTSSRVTTRSDAGQQAEDMFHLRAAFASALSNDTAAAPKQQQQRQQQRQQQQMLAPAQPVLSEAVCIPPSIQHQPVQQMQASTSEDDAAWFADWDAETPASSLPRPASSAAASAPNGATSRKPHLGAAADSSNSSSILWPWLPTAGKRGLVRRVRSAVGAADAGAAGNVGEQQTVATGGASSVAGSNDVDSTGARGAVVQKSTGGDEMTDVEDTADSNSSGSKWDTDAAAAGVVLGAVEAQGIGGAFLAAAPGRAQGYGARRSRHVVKTSPRSRSAVQDKQ